MTYNLNKLLIILGLVLVPFYELIFRCFPFVAVMAPDTRQPKTLIALGIALSIGLLAVYQGNIKPFRNKFLLIIPVYLLFNLFMSPHVDLFLNNVQSGDLFFWKPFSEVLIFSLMIIAIASTEDFDGILKVMVICGAVMAGYVVLQKLGFDQFWLQKEGEQFISVTGRNLGGNLGQSTVVASFIAMIIPIAFYCEKYWMAGLMIISEIVLSSDMSMIALIFTGLIYLTYKNNNLLIPILSVLIILFISGIIFYNFNIKFHNNISERFNGRIGDWKNIFTDIRDGAIDGSKQDFSATGVGFGRFAFIFPDRHKSNFQQAHNDLLEFTYNCGLIGLGLLLIGLFYLLSTTMMNITPMSLAILLSFSTILLISLGSFPFQLASQQFYSAVLLGLLNNKKITEAVR